MGKAPRIAMIGCGNMGGAIAQRWLDTAIVPQSGLCACTSRPASAAEVTRRLGIEAGTNLAEAVADVDVVVLGFKPQGRVEILAQLRNVLGDRKPLVVSLLAGVELAELRGVLGPRVARWMPNTPVLTGAGVVGQCAPGLSEADVTTLAGLAAPLGLRVDVAERDFNALTAVAGCGPAYVFLFCEALASAGTSAGLDRDVAQQLARQVAVGAGLLLASAPEQPAELRERVTSKGGMTEAALQQLRRQGWGIAMHSAVAAAVERGQQLAAPPRNAK